MMLLNQFLQVVGAFSTLRRMAQLEWYSHVAIISIKRVKMKMEKLLK
jgi:hypothetical protein